MAVNLSPVGGVAAQFFTNSGVILSGGKLYTYLAGTTTPVAAYTTSNGGTAWTNPIVLDAAGRVPGSGEIWLTDGINYKFVLKDSNDVLIATYDNITGINSNAVAYTNQQEIVTATAGQTVFNLGISYQPATNSLSVFVDGVNQYGPGAQYSYVETDSNTVTFNSGLHVGAEVKFTTTQQQGAGLANALQITYDPPFTGSVPTNVEAKLAQTVSVKDFGAVGNGIADDTQAIQDAVAYIGTLSDGGQIIFPSGTYLVSGEILLPSNVHIYGQYNAVININPLNWTGAITKFYALFTTINVPAPPEVGYWRLGTGTLTYFNIQIENLTINLNRDGNVLTPTQMTNSAFNAVRFEDAQNCYVKNCRFIDKMTQANHNAYTMVVFFVRSQQCYVDGCAFERTSCLFMPESRYCGFTNSTSIYGNSSPVESIAGEGHYIANNNFGVYWETTSCVGINTPQCVIEQNVFTAPMLMAVVLGHDQPSPPEPSQYGVSLKADYSIVRHNSITGITATNFGIFIQNAANVQIDSNTIVDLGKAAAYNTDDKIGIRVSGTGTVDRFVNNSFTNNTIINATAGIRISDGDSITISENNITNVRSGIYLSGTSGYEALVSGNYIKDAESAILSYAGSCRTINNRIYNITANGPTQWSIYFAYGVQQFSHNSVGGIGECCMFNFTAAEVMNNVFTNSPAIAGNLWLLNNDDGAAPAAGTATAYQINIAGNKNDAFTNFVHTYRVFDYGTTDFAQNLIATVPGSTTWNPGSIASGSGETSPSVSVTYAAFGNPVMVAAPYDLQGMTATAYVDGSNSVRIRVDNNTGAPINLASGTWKVWVLKA